MSQDKKGKEISKAINRLRKKMYKPSVVSASGLEYLEGAMAQDYYYDMSIAQIYARLNRMIMGHFIVEDFFKLLPGQCEFIESVHNYINFEDGIIRKGAISAHKNEKVIIPLNMADGVIIGVGKGNEDWNNSAPHGAGRLMSRGKARATISLDDFKSVMKESGVWSSCIGRSTLDESPQAYKKADTIVEYLKDTVDVQHRMKPVYNFKATN